MSSNRWWETRLVVRQPVVWIIVILGMILSATGTAQQPPETPPVGTAQPPNASPAATDPSPDDADGQPAFRSEINFVQVDVIVTDDDDDSLVLDLTAEDFEIYEDDLLQQIETFELIQITGAADPALPLPASIRNEYDQRREAARSDSRIFVFFLDDYHVYDINAMRMLLQLEEFVETQLAPTDLVGVMYPLTPLLDLEVTRDHARVIRALQSFKGRKYNYEPANIFEMQYADYPTTMVERIRNNVSLSALRGLTIHLGGLREGKKSVIVVSEGYSNYVPPQMRDQNAAGGGLFASERYNAFAGNTAAEEKEQFFESSSMLTDLLYVADTANKNNTSLYTLDPRGLAVFEFDVSGPTIAPETDNRIMRDLQNTLHTLAEQTDGRAIVNRNDVLPGLAQLVRDQSAYYLLGYTSSEAPTDGKFHEIEVKVARMDVDVRARPGYYALTDEDAARILAPPRPETPKAIDKALATLAEPTRGRLVRTWVGMRRGDNGKTQVTFVWEPVGNNQSQRRESASQVTLMAMGDGGAYFRGSVPARGTDSPRVEFEADPGVIELNARIEDEYGDVIDRRVDEITILDFTGIDVTLSTPVVLRGRTALETRQHLTDPDALPTASRYFRRTDGLLVRVEAYAPGDIPPIVTAQLLSREGTSMRELPIGQPAAGRPHELALQLAPFPRGEYMIEISATPGGAGDFGGSAATTLIAFRIQ